MASPEVVEYADGFPHETVGVVTRRLHGPPWNGVGGDAFLRRLLENVSPLRGRRRGCQNIGDRITVVPVQGGQVVDADR